MALNLKLSRDQFAKIAKGDPEATKQLEKLFATVNSMSAGGLPPDGVYGDVTVSAGGTIWTVTSSGVADGDYGDITVSGGGTVFTIDNSVVTNAKMADMPAGSFKARQAGVGPPLDVNGFGATQLLSVMTPGLGQGVVPNSVTVSGRVYTDAGTFETIGALLSKAGIPIGLRGDDGDDGAMGPPGRDGTSGTIGRDGAQGPPGWAGDDGDDGSPGPPGNTGATGAAGAAGSAGPPGLAGDDGEDGSWGPPGANGAAGAAGAQGPPGWSGDDGDDGVMGPPGRDGVIGRDGVAGQPGPPGWADDGDDGAMGPPGANGAAGAVGAAGAAGRPGFDGSDGDDGPWGPPGRDGVIGRDGAAGQPGPPGRDGDDGDQGPQGVPGRDGSPTASVSISSDVALTATPTSLTVTVGVGVYWFDYNALFTVTGAGNVNIDQDATATFTGEMNASSGSLAATPVVGSTSFSSLPVVANNVSLASLRLTGFINVTVAGTFGFKLNTSGAPAVANYFKGSGLIVIPQTSTSAVSTPPPITIKTVEANLGATASKSGRFTLTDAAIGATSKVTIWQAPGPYTGKGTLADEAEMDPLWCVAVPAAGSAVVRWRTQEGAMPTIAAGGGARETAVLANVEQRPERWQMQARGLIKGNFKFFYMVG